MICALSGQEPMEPVVSPTGNVFERSLIEKYLEQNETCPVTGEPLSVEELITLKVSKTVQPRPAGSASIPGLLQTFQNEWDAAVLESFTLKKQLDTVRQELAHALYQHDASCRVIARLIKERDEARQALIDLKNDPSAHPTSMDIEKNTEGFTSALQEEMTTLSVELSTKRPSRDTSSLPTEKIQQFSKQMTRSIHKASAPGVLCVDIHSKDPTKVVTGGMDCTAVLFDTAHKKKLATLSGHSKPVSSVAFHPEDTLIVTGSRDKTVRVWRAETGTTNYSSAETFSGHSGDITSLLFHPLHDYFITTSLDKTWGFHNIETGKTLVTASSSQIKTPTLCGDIHPDCLLLGTGQEDGSISLWNIMTQSVVLSFGEHKQGTKALKFSQSGYQLVSVGSDEIALWDVRNPQAPVERTAFDPSFDPTSLSLTHSSAYVAVCGSDVAIYETNSLEEIVRLSDHTDRVMDVQWDQNGQFLASVSLDRSLKIFA